MFSKTSLLASLALVCGITRATPIAYATHLGNATWYHPGLVACGVTNNDGDFTVAVSAAVFDSFGTSVCGLQITATTPDGRSVTVTVEDRCAGCATNDINLSSAAFRVLADPSFGRIRGVTWSF